MIIWQKFNLDSEGRGFRDIGGREGGRIIFVCLGI